MRVTPNTTVRDTAFTRASSGAYVNVSGVLATAGTDVARISFDALTHEPIGMLLEAAATNLFTYSEQSDNAAWTAAAATIGVNAVAAPDGTTTADKLIETATTAAHSLTRTAAQTIAAYGVNTGSVFVKAAGRTALQVKLANGADTNSITYQFDLSAGTVSSATVVGLSQSTSATITPYGNGWYRCSVTGILDSFSTTANLTYTLMDGAATSYLGVITSGVYLWGHQLEAGQLTSYIATTAAAATRAADVLTGAAFGSSSIPEPDASVGEAIWVSGTPYAEGVYVILQSTHRRYKCILGVTGTLVPNLDGTHWADAGPTNRWAMLDLNSNIQTVSTGPIVLVMAPGKRVTSWGLVGVVASSVRLQMVVGGVVYYDTTVTMTRRSVTNWMEYFLNEFQYTANTVKFDLPPMSGATVIITINGGTVKCGGLVVGNSVYLGRSQPGASSDALNFSKVDRDAFGTATLVPRRSVPTIDVKVEAESGSVNAIRQVRTDLNAVVALWSAVDDQVGNNYFDLLLTVGIYKKFVISVDYNDQAGIALQLEEI